MSRAVGAGDCARRGRRRSDRDLVVGRWDAGGAPDPRRNRVRHLRRRAGCCRGSGARSSWAPEPAVRDRGGDRDRPAAARARSPQLDDVRLRPRRGDRGRGRCVRRSGRGCRRERTGGRDHQRCADDPHRPARSGRRRASTSTIRPAPGTSSETSPTPPPRCWNGWWRRKPRATSRRPRGGISWRPSLTIPYSDHVAAAASAGSRGRDRRRGRPTGVPRADANAHRGTQWR